ncbi:MAG: hypothetical protein ACKO3S_01655 [bacterium]
MRKSVALTTIALALSLATAARAAVLETEPQVFPVGQAKRVHLEFPVGDLRVVPSDGDRVELRLQVRCSRGSVNECNEFANRLVLESRERNGVLRLHLDKFPKWRNNGFSLRGELRVPRQLALSLEMGVGDLDVAGIESDLDVDLGVGEATVSLPRRTASQVHVKSGVGEAAIVGGATGVQRSGVVGSSAKWVASEGNGRANVKLAVGVGEATVRLE